MPNRGSSVWTWHCKNTIIQRNRCLHVRGYLDSHGIHIDHHNDHTYVQYNYMEDCEGGFVEILGGNTNAERTNKRFHYVRTVGEQLLILNLELK